MARDAEDIAERLASSAQTWLEADEAIREGRVQIHRSQVAAQPDGRGGAYFDLDVGEQRFRVTVQPLTKD